MFVGHIPLYAPTKAPHRQALHQTAKPRQTSFETARATWSAWSRCQERKIKMTQLELIVKALTNLGGKGTYSEIYREFERLSGEMLTPGRKAGIRKVQHPK